MKTRLDLPVIAERIRNIHFPDIDLVIGIASGGVVPASLIAFHLKKPLKVVSINYRDEANNPRYDVPKLLTEIDQTITGIHILLVDDVSVSGKTLIAAQNLFSDCKITTCVLKGQADISAFPEISTCVEWPWKNN